MTLISVSLARHIARRRTRTLIAMLSVASSLASFAALAEAPYLQAAQPITDTQGRVQVIIDFRDDAHVSYAGESPLPVRPAPGVTPAFFHQPRVLNLVADYETRYGFVRLGITSWVGNSVGAFLTPGLS